MVVIQNSINTALIDEKNLVNTLQQVLDDLGKREAELLIRLVGRDEIQSLNKAYRHQDKPTNVLSFPSDLPKEIEEVILGDVVICPEIVRTEAKSQNKTFSHHLLHIAIHGTLHLLGYDHLQPTDAKTMEALEVQILAKLQINNPYI